MQVAQLGTSPGQSAPPKSGSSWHLWANGSFSFHDVLDAINPLQHLPIVSTIYREVTGDKIGNAARVAGDSLYGGVIGLAVGLVNAMSVSDTGKDLGERAIAMVDGTSEPDAVPGEKAAGNSSLAPKGSVTVEPAAFQSSPTMPSAQSAKIASTVMTSKASDLASGMSGKTISMAAALAALPNRPPVDLPFFPGAAARSGANTSPGANQAVPGADQAATSNQLASLSLATATKPIALGLNAPPHGIAIDTSQAGIMAIRSKGHGQAPIPLQISSGAFLAQNAPASGNGAADGTVVNSASMTALGHKDDNGNDFVIRMRQGIEKYNALLDKQRAKGNAEESRKAMNIDTRSTTGASAGPAGLLN